MNDAELQSELLKDFLIESAEGLDSFDAALLLLEKGQPAPDTLHAVFRVVHTIKGTAGCLGLHRIERMAHAGENLLSLLRDGRLPLSPGLLEAQFAFADALRRLLREAEAPGAAAAFDCEPLLARLHALADVPAVETEAAAATAPEGWGLFEAPAVATATPAAAPAEAAPTWGVFDEPAAAPAPAVTRPAPAPAADAAPESASRASVADTAIRVDVAHLDRLMNRVGELVLARNQLLQHLAATRDGGLAAIAQRLSLITTELQEGVMKTRMQPIGHVWAKFPRLVRDVAHELGKDVRLVLEGRETELDRTLVEAIKDPLTHIVRNAIDHGLEASAARVAAGKPAHGTLQLRAFHESGQVNIEVRDDGAGIALERVRAKAVEKGLLTAEQASRLTDREAVELIFLPGLSTAAKLSNLSGRGVGMDVVKTNIERVGGSVDVQTSAGLGTTLRIKIPLTLAIIPALIVSSGGESFAIPQASLVELVRLDTAGPGIETVFDANVYRLRGRLLPLVRINHVLELAPVDRTAEDSAGILVVLQADGRQFGLVVDAVNDTEEIVVKPLGRQLRQLEVFSGATIMGDGRVALILDVMGLAQHAHLAAAHRAVSAAEEGKAGTGVGERQALLLFSVGGRSRLAVPLAQAARLEEFPRAKVEQAGGRSVVQYRGGILPLVQVADHLPGAHAEQADPLQVVVYSEDQRRIGLVVGHINDIVEETLTLDPAPPGGSILGSAVVQGRVTDVLDVRGLVRAAEPAFFASAA